MVKQANTQRYDQPIFKLDYLFGYIYFLIALGVENDGSSYYIAILVRINIVRAIAHIFCDIGFEFLPCSGIGDARR